MLASVIDGRTASRLCVVLVLGAVVGVASSLANRVPYGVVDHTALGMTRQMVVGIISSIAVWFAVPFVLGYLLFPSRRRSAASGAAFTGIAILSYFVHSSTGVDVEGVTVSSRLLEWLVVAVAGGVIAGVIGFFARERPNILLVLVLVIGVELARRGTLS